MTFGVGRNAAHHASSGNHDRRGLGDVKTLTVREYLARSLWGRLCYRLCRHPIVMFGIGPAYLFVVQQRLPVGMLRGDGWPGMRVTKVHRVFSGEKERMAPWREGRLLTQSRAPRPGSGRPTPADY